jgi:uncharacterized membrane protein (UPF0127 family)
VLRAVPLLMMLLAACACQKASSRPEGAEAGDDFDDHVAAQATAARVHLAGADGVDHAVTVEVVRGEAELRKGLMYRKHLDADAGMLFMMGEESDHTFWMRNTLIPLDMMFITRDLHVAGVSANAVPQTDDLRSVGKPSLYVLEVNGGWTKKHGVTAGAQVRFENVKQ